MALFGLLMLAPHAEPIVERIGRHRLAERSPIATDRPDFTESALTVPVGALQVESGFTRSKLSGRTETSGPETLFRYSPRSRFEWRLTLPDRIWTRQEDSWGDVAFGAKWQLGPCANGMDAALIADVAYAVEGSGRRPSYGIALCLAGDLSEVDGLSSMIRFDSVATGAGRTESGTATASLSRDLGKGWAGFFEYAGTFSEGERPLHLAHFGGVFQPSTESQWDFHAGWDLDKGPKRYFVGIGYSFRL